MSKNKSWVDWIYKILNWLWGLINSSSIGEQQSSSITDSINEENKVEDEHNKIDESTPGVEETEDGGLNFDNINK